MVRSAALDPPGDSRGKSTGQSRETPDPFAFVCAVVWFAACIFAFRPGENIRSSRFFFCALVWMALCAAASMFRPRAPGRHRGGEIIGWVRGYINNPEFTGFSDDVEGVRGR